MRRWLLALVLAAWSALVGCAPNPPRPPTDAGWPDLPATVTADENAPPLPARGPIGRGALLLSGTTAVVHLVLEDGRQFRLPDPPRGEGWFGTIAASLSPDGWWLGLRTARQTGDPGYLVRSLADGKVVSTTGIPVVWSANGDWLLLQENDRFTVLDLATGDRHPVGASARQAMGLLPTGELVRFANHSNSVEWRTGDGAPVAVRFADRDDEACWCPVGSAVLSPDGTRVSVGLASRGGTSPSRTDAKVPANPDAGLTVVVLDRATGAEIHRATLTVPDAIWAGLMADRGQDLVFVVAGSLDQTTMVALDPASGAQQVVMVGPAPQPGKTWVVTTPGKVTRGWSV